MQGADSENSPLPFSLPFAPKRKINFLIRLKAKHPLVFISLPERNLTPFALKRKAFVCDTGHSVKVLVVFGDASNKLSVSMLS